MSEYYTPSSSRRGSSSSLNPNAQVYTASPETKARMEFCAFPQFQSLQEELIVSILTFVAQAPDEKPSNGLQVYESTLTHVLPLVSKHFRTICNSHFLWKVALTRLVRKEPLLWKVGLQKFLTMHPSPQIQQEDMMHTSPSSSSSSSLANITTNMNTNTKSNSKSNTNNRSIEAELVNTAGESMEYLLSNENASLLNPYIELYKFVLSSMRYTSPLFYMPDPQLALGREFGLHFFEPRYRLLINEVMAPYPAEFKKGEPINAESTGTFPTFIYANFAPLKRGTPACIVQVRQCVIHPNHTADVFLMPVEYARIEEVWERPNSLHLYEAKVLRMGSEEQNRLEEKMAEDDRRRRSGNISNMDNDQNNVQEYIHAMLQLLASSNERNNQHDDT